MFRRLQLKIRVISSKAFNTDFAVIQIYNIFPN